MSIFSLMAGDAYEQLKDKFPGPEPSAPLGNAGAFMKNPWEAPVRYFEEYGDVVLVWMGTTPALLLNDPRLVEELLITADGNWEQDDRFYKDSPREALLPIVTDTSCFINNGKPWHDKRSAHPFSAKDFNAWLARQVGPVRRSVSESLSELSEYPKAWDMRSGMERMSFDGFAVMLVGEALGDEMYEDFQVISDEATQRLSPIHLPEALAFRFKKSKDEWFDGFQKYITGAQQDPTGDDLVRSFLPGSSMDPASFRVEVANVFPAGIYSVTSSVMATLWQLVTNPEELTKVQAALSAMPDDWTWEDLQACSPLRWALLEGMRLYPGAPFYSRNLKTTGPVEFAGATLPADSQLYITPVALQRNRKHWGEDADVFRPGRWEAAEAANAFGSDYYFPFGRGPRECLGKAFGLAYAQIALATCLRKWQWEVDDRRVEPGWYFACMVHEGLKARVKPRR